MNANDFTPLKSPDQSPLPSSLHSVSICIPARNEEAVIARAVKSALEQNYPNIEIIVLDDQSTDATAQILRNIKFRNQESFKIVEGKPKPDSWLGKSWACHQLSEAASGELLFFMDADAWLEPEAVSRIVQTIDYYAVDFLTVWPVQKTGTFWEKIVIPLIYYGLFSLLPARYVHRPPRWLPSSLARQLGPKFAAACGQAMVFKCKAYDQIGGHESVKNEIVEDVALAKQIKRNGCTMRMCHGWDAVHCRMYTAQAEMWQGFRKNFLALYNHSVPVFIIMAVLNFIVYVLPFITLPVALATGDLMIAVVSSIAVAVIWAHRLLIARWYPFSIPASLLHPLGVLWFHALGVRVLVDHFKNHRAQWKDRPT